MSIENSVQQFWNDLVAKDVTLKFSVTDKELALKSLGQLMGPNGVGLPGLAPKAIVLVNNIERVKEYLDKLNQLSQEYRDVINLHG